MQTNHHQSLLNLSHVKRSLYLKQTQHQQQQHQQQQQQQHAQLQRHSLHLAIPITSQPIQSTHSPSVRYKEPVRQNLPIQLNSLNQTRFSQLELNNHKFNIIKNTSASIDLNTATNNAHNIFKQKQTPVASSTSFACTQQIQNICKSLVVQLSKKEETQLLNINNVSNTKSNNRYSHGRQGVSSQHKMQDINQRDSSVTATTTTTTTATAAAATPSAEKFFKTTKIPSAVFKANQKSFEALGAIKMQLKDKTMKIQANKLQQQQKLSQEKNSGELTSIQQQQEEVEEMKQNYQQQPQLVGRGKRDLLKNMHVSRELRKSSDSQENEDNNGNNTNNSPVQSLFFGMKDSITVTKSLHNDGNNLPQQQQCKDQKRSRNNLRRIKYGDSRDLSQDNLVHNQKDNSFCISQDQVIQNEESEEEGTEHIPQLFRKLVSPVIADNNHGGNLNNPQVAGRALTNNLLSGVKTHHNRTLVLLDPPNQHIFPHSPCSQPKQIISHNILQENHKISPQYCSSVALQVAMMSVNTPLKGKGKANSTEFKSMYGTKELIQRKFHSDNKKKAHNEFIQSFFPSLFSQEKKKNLMPSKFS